MKTKHLNTREGYTPENVDMLNDSYDTGTGLAAGQRVRILKGAYEGEEGEVWSVARVRPEARGFWRGEFVVDVLVDGTEPEDDGSLYPERLEVTDVEGIDE